MARVGMTVPQMMRNCCTIDGRQVYLTRSTGLILQRLLISHPERAVSADELWEVLWGDDIAGGPLGPDATIRSFIYTLRKIGVEIEILKGFGWRIAAEHRGPRLPSRITISPSEERQRDYLFGHQRVKLAA